MYFVRVIIWVFNRTTSILGVSFRIYRETLSRFFVRRFIEHYARLPRSWRMVRIPFEKPAATAE
ncbi:hypothetical protein ABLN64_03965, partial [Mycobacterium tuberculosis]